MTMVFELFLFAVVVKKRVDKQAKTTIAFVAHIILLAAADISMATAKSMRCLKEQTILFPTEAAVYA